MFFNLGEYGVAAKPLSERIALHSENVFNLGEYEVVAKPFE